jgi:fatty acyl-CoA reductase
LEKLKIIKGDILEDGLGIDNSDQQELIDNVNIVFHSAASVRFGEFLESFFNFTDE